MTTNRDKLPLVLLHAYLFDHSLWDFTRAALGKDVHVLAPDLPGFGHVPPLSTEPSIDALADYIAAWLKNQGVKRAVIAGMSMGGYVALALTERHPELVAGLGLISTQVEPDSPGMKRLRRTIISSVRKHGPSAAMESLVEKLFAPQFQSNAEVTEPALHMAAQATAEAVCWALQAMANRPDRSELLKKITIPTLVVHGTKDDVATIDRARIMASLNRGTVFIELPENGHAVPLESPAIVAKALMDLVGRCHDPARGADFSPRA